MIKSSDDRTTAADGQTRPNRRDDVESGAGSHHHGVGMESMASSSSSTSTTSTEDSGSLNSESRESLSHISTHVSLGPDNPVDHYSSYVDIPDEVYDRIPRHRKLIIVALLSFCSFLAPISSTSVLAATPEVAAEYDTTGSVINIVNAIYMLFMGISPIFWGPLSEVWGRKLITCTTAILFLACSIGTALSPNLAAFFIFRVLTAFEGTAFLLVGSACLGDIFRPTERATAMGWFLSGTLIGPAFGPFIGGIIVTYASWRVIFWLQTGLAGLAALGAFTLLPETIHHKKIDDLEGFTKWRKFMVLWGMINPIRVLRLYQYPNLIVVGFASSSLVWNMYGLLTPIRYVLNPRFNLTTPMQGGLFYLAPGCGYVIGTFFGGRYADHIVRKQIKNRGTRVAEDRMLSALPFMGVVIPTCVLIYGWGVDQDVGGIPLAVITLFLQGVAQLFCFPSLNTYCLDVMQSRGSDVIAGNYFVRYLFACVSTAVVLPAIESIGVGWFQTISALFLVLSAVGVWATVRWGKKWRDKVDRRRRAKRVAAREKAKEQLRAQHELAEHEAAGPHNHNHTHDQEEMHGEKEAAVVGDGGNAAETSREVETDKKKEEV